MPLRLRCIVLFGGMLLLAQQQLDAQSHRHSSGSRRRATYSSPRSYTARTHGGKGHSYRSNSPATSYRVHRPSVRLHSRPTRSRTYALRRNVGGHRLRPSVRVHSFRVAKDRAHIAGVGRPRRARAYSAPGSRDRRGRLKRSAAAKDAFMRVTGHPRGWPGHVVDHRVALACGGSDTPSNMQWQTIESARAKDKIERRGCR